MEIELNTLLVALMFVTILSMGIGNILTTLADIFNNATSSTRSRGHIAWIVLLLMVHFNLFWHTKAILDVEDWAFPGFLLTMAGPVLMFFATSILLTPPPEEFQPSLDAFFAQLGRRFYGMFALLQFWIVAVSYLMAGSFVMTDLVNILFGLLALALVLNDGRRLQAIGVWLAWALGVGSLIIRWLVQAA